MKILFICNDLPYFDRHRRAHMQRLFDAGHEILLACGQAGDSDLVRSFAPVEVIPLALKRQHFAPFGDPMLVRTIMRMVVRHRPDVVHAITVKPVVYSACAFQALPRRHLNGTRLVMTFPGLGKTFEQLDTPFRRLRKWLVTRMLAASAKRTGFVAIVENDWDKQRLIMERAVPESHIEVITGTGIDLEMFQPGLKEGPLKIMFAARMLRAKGVDRFLEAATELKREFPDVEFHLAGLYDQSVRDYMPRAAVELAAVSGDIIWHGALSRQQLSARLAASDIFCLPTRLQEGLPVSLMEAAACGCALIATDLPACRFLISPGENGWLLPAPDKQSVVAALREACESPDTSRRMGERSRFLIERLPVSVAAVSDAQLALYQRGAMHPQ